MNKPARVSFGTGVITPHVDRHVRRSPPGDESSRIAAPRSEVSIVGGFKAPQVDRHIARSRSGGVQQRAA